jgi:hypothetical protein
MTEDYNFYLDNQIPEEERRDVAFQTVNAIRESVTLAKNTTLPITYEFAFNIIYDLDPKLYNAIIILLTSKNEIVKFYTEKAKILQVKPVELIEKELEELEELLIPVDKEDSFYLRKRKFGLIAAKEFFTPRVQSEHKSLSHDFYLSSRDDYFGKPLYQNDEYKDYKITDNKLLRLRLLHPDKDEAILGVDLIYEHFDMKLERVRFAHMQYKTWNTNALYETSSTNLIPQIQKMEKHLCKSGFCKGPKNAKRDDYRFPYCSGFLRPTSKLQKSDSKLITTGLHIPICQALKLFKDDKKITKENTRDKSIKGIIFEELFITNIAGSRWIPIDELEKFYVKKKIDSHLNTIRIHAQEVDIYTEEEKNKTR